MSKRTTRAMRTSLWVAAAVLCCLSAAMLTEANKRESKIAEQQNVGGPSTTGSIKHMRWCGAAPWCN